MGESLDAPAASASSALQGLLLAAKGAPPGGATRPANLPLRGSVPPRADFTSTCASSLWAA